MDIVREKKKRKFKSVWLISLPLVLLLGWVIVASVTNDVEAKVDLNDVRMATVQQGAFDIVVRAPGTLVATDIEWLSAEVGGRVESVNVLPGSEVNPGDIIAKLSNPELLQNYRELQWDLEAEEATQDVDLMNLESVVLDQQLAELNAKISYESSRMTHAAQTELQKRNVSSVSEIEFETIRMETVQKQQHWDIEKQRTQNLQKKLAAQARANNAHIVKLKNKVERVKEQVDELEIRAGIRSVVQEISIEPGQLISAGSSIAKLVQQDKLIARISVPEVQAHNIASGQDVIIDTRKSRVSGRVTRVSPSVSKGALEIDVAFIDTLPQEARPDLSVDAEVSVVSIDKAVYVERPAFSKSNSQMRVFLVSEDGATAIKHSVEFGRASASQIEIISGLKPGEKIIVSDQSAFEDFEAVALGR